MEEEYAGTVWKVISPIEVVIDCSCWLCYEYVTVHFREPHPLTLNAGDWVRVYAGERYNHTREECSAGYFYFWDIDAERIERTTREEEIAKLEADGRTDCGWYETLVAERASEAGSS